MNDMRAVSLAVFAVSFVIGFSVFEASKVDDRVAFSELQLSMVPLFPSNTTE
jgi:hypothetical protein